MPELSIALLLLITGFIAGACNAVAGGGTFFTFPAFLAAGLPPIVANASNSVAVWPGHAFAAIGYRTDLSRLARNVRGSLVALHVNLDKMVWRRRETFTAQAAWVNHC